ncbi:MAG TPA: (d)CMP kinase [Anaerolineae bacterium]|nr:(d)CMP kinase [Anaerolineae bacterium]
MPEITIAIDGPAASGKSTVAAILAARLGYLYFDTGVMYRAVTWVASDRSIPVEDELAVTRLAESLCIEVSRPTIDDGRQYTVLADQQDVTWRIREPEVNRFVSAVSAYRGVRAALTRQQRRVGAGGAVVMVGRDIGTVVFPRAEVKIYLDATVEERARRRHLEEKERGLSSNYESVLADLSRRDRIDSSRKEAPLRAAEDAVVIDSTGMSRGQVVAQAEALVRAALEFDRRTASAHEHGSTGSPPRG